MKRPMGWDKVAIAHLFVVVLPTGLYCALRTKGHSLFALHVAVATAFLLTAAMIVVETTLTVFRRFAGQAPQPEGLLDAWVRRCKRALGIEGARRPDPARPMPRCSIVFVAYLPNEQDLIVGTLRHALTRLRRPPEGFEVVLAYNTPVRLPVEDELEALAREHPELRLLHVEGSESKAENLNAAIDVVTGEVTAIMDADHHPAPDALERAWRWIEAGYDVVQGRSTIRNHGRNWQTRLIAVEFECMYGVSHPARSLLVDTAIFGGSNGYWRTEALRQVRFDPAMMTEDIDASVRALLQGLRIMHDRSITSSELAPTDFRSFWFQRKRWAQGWLEVTLKYQRRLWGAPGLTFGQKLYWSYLLLYRELYPVITLQIFPILISLYLVRGAIPLTAHWYLLASAVVTVASGPYQTLSAVKNSRSGFPVGYALLYAAFVFFYVMLKNVISILAMYDHAFGHNEWIVTRREADEELKRKVAGG
ncbi:MAG: glycosyltransferase family 2 protein [Deferrisomatales bacterium]